jgi:hypothetical protein
MSTIPDSLGMTSYTLSILFLALKPTVKKLFSIEIHCEVDTSEISESKLEKYQRELA